MSWIPVGLLGVAVAILVAAEWPRLGARLGFGPERHRRRRRRKGSHLSVVPNGDESLLEDDREAFAASVARDLERLPTIDDRD